MIIYVLWRRENFRISRTIFGLFMQLLDVDLVPSSPVKVGPHNTSDKKRERFRPLFLLDGKSNVQ